MDKSLRVATRTPALTALLLAAAVLVTAPGEADASSSPRAMYTAALARERSLRDASRRPPTLKEIRNAVAAYEAIVRRHPRSGYSDNALWQAAGLALLAYERFGEDRDRRAGQRFLSALRSEYPSSSLIRRIPEQLKLFETAAARRAAVEAARRAAARPAPRTAEQPAAPAIIRDIRRTALPEGVRVVVELDAEVPVHQEQIENPRRVFFDLRGARISPTLNDADLAYADGIVREIRLGRHPNQTARIVVEFEESARYSAFALSDPYRLVIDFRREGAGDAVQAAVPIRPGDARAPTAGRAGAEPAPIAATPTLPATLPSPAAPAANAKGKYSVARQLGLGVSRIVIDPGHGGHDPGAVGPRISEAEVVLDVARRLEKLLQAEPGFEVVLTRRTDVFVPLEERTAIANRAGADLFLSIHANASRNPQARGVETYVLNFATSPEAEAVAARENAASGGRAMHNLPEILRAIALNNKLDESRELAGLVQAAMVRQLRSLNAEVRNLGVKQAPFVVLIGANMPSVLAEISFVSNRAEAQLLRTPAYRQQIAEALFEAVVAYQRSLRSQQTVAEL